MTWGLLGMLAALIITYTVIAALLWAHGERELEQEVRDV